MNLEQEPKYAAIDGRLVNRTSGQAIPDDEPVFIFRARDVLALAALSAYADRLPAGTHLDAVTRRMGDFARFAKEHPDRMKTPDTAPAAAKG